MKPYIELLIIALVIHAAIYLLILLAGKLCDLIVKSKVLSNIVLVLLVFPIFLYYPVKIVAWIIDLITKSNQPKSDPTNPLEIRQFRPLERFIARSIDLSIIYLCGGIAAGILELVTGRQVVFTAIYLIILNLALIPIEAWMLSTWSTTPGKWFMKIKVLNTNGQKLNYLLALKRGLFVTLLGTGAGISLIAQFEQLYWVLTLSESRPVYWDRASNSIVLHEEVPLLRWAILFLPIVLIMLAATITGIFIALFCAIMLIIQ